MSKPVLVPTDVAVAFLLKCKGQESTAETRKVARERIYSWAKQGRLTRHGESKRGQALWDLHELVKPYSSGWTIVDNRR